jgi:hypothetical protein
MLGGGGLSDALVGGLKGRRGVLGGGLQAGSLGEGGTGRLRGSTVDAWVGSMHHLLPWLPPQIYAKIGSF